MERESLILGRGNVAEADAILGREFQCLDKGFVRLIDYMGDDYSIAQAARVSYGKGTKRVHEDSALIRYLMRHRHTTPFEMVEFKFHVRVPMDCWRQWIRHRTASVNEYSTRYSEAIDSTQQTPQNAWRTQDRGNRQGSSGFLDEKTGVELTKKEEELHKRSREIYQQRLNVGVAREQARKDLPLSTYTEAYWKIDLHNLFHFLELRMHYSAQKEIREYANNIASIVKVVVPVAYEAFEDYRLNAINLSKLDAKAISEIIGGENPEKAANQIFANKRERSEFLEKWERVKSSANNP